MTATIKPSLPWVSVYAGQTCVGHVLNRGKTGFEAINTDDQAVGIFDSAAAAASALEKLASAAPIQPVSS